MLVRSLPTINATRRRTLSYREIRGAGTNSDCTQNYSEIAKLDRIQTGICISEFISPRPMMPEAPFVPIFLFQPLNWGRSGQKFGTIKKPGVEAWI